MTDLLIDTTRIVGRLIKKRLPTGIDRVCLAYVRRYASAARAVVKNGRFGMVLSKAASQDLFGMVLAADRDFQRRAAGLLAKGALFSWRAPPAPGSLILNLGHTGLDQPGYADWSKQRQLRTIAMVHDLIPVTHPEYCRAGEYQRHASRMENVLRTAAAVVTNSAATLRILSTFAASCGLKMPTSASAPLAPSVFSGASGRRPLEQPYFVMLSTIEPRKNHGMMLQVWRRLIERHGSAAPRLVVIGQHGWMCENVIDLLQRCPVLRGFVLQKNGCSDSDLATYLRHSQALLFPSFVEGYGLPLIEALSLQVPAIASDLPVFREFAGEIPEYLDPRDGSAWMKRIEEFCDPRSKTRSAQLGRMKRFEAPTWASHFQKFEELLARAC